jgi:hypothetical protein
VIKLLSIFLIIVMFSNTIFANCDFSKVVKNSDDTFTYSKDLHLCVGQLVQDNKTKDLQIADLTKSLSFKDLALKTADDRTQLWMDTTFKLENNINRIDELKKSNEWIYFGLGALTVIATGFALSSVTSRR